MKKVSWITIAIGLILIGLGGAAYYKFHFADPLETHSQAWTFGEGELRQLTINGEAKSLNVRFVPSTDGRNSVTLNGREEQEVIDRLSDVTVRDGKLELNLNTKFKWFNMDLDFSSRKQEIVVALSGAGRLDAVTVKSDSGSVSVDGSKARTVEISSDSGALRASNIEAGTLELKADSGSVRLSGIAAEQVTVKTDSGSVQGDGMKGDASVSTDSGSIKLAALTGAAAIDSDSGSVRLQKQDTSSSSVKTDSGSVRVELTAAFAGQYDLRSDSGSIHAPDSPGQSTDVLKVRTDSGSIRVETSE
ncbi:DUF4097 family beta strand repeat-containing protein [Cohnella sp. JJ-181]|uniref:DUF4097 family beta strand repeat-containing protein n=1 Tax=Cohnella rhizoplanae TaxID=2974897 RepID=UPI0022FF7C0F|nr:DUF4097 family beta strand repeat-containing protein [Cohnella sp. JJ-181]CAI6081731.1 hypothetical protein COHCIP112018_03408 [Cohnella sp. JJ-181]